MRRIGSTLSRGQLIAIVRGLTEAETEAEYDEMLATLEDNVLHPRVLDLIFHADPELTPEEVIDQALAYEPIQL